MPSNGRWDHLMNDRTTVVRMKTTLRRALGFCLMVGCILYAGKLMAAAQNPSCSPPPGGLVGWWQAAGDANDSAGTNNGILLGGTLANAPGMVGSAFSFDGTNG